jgi:16S rRNA processing protein RimM
VVEHASEDPAHYEVGARLFVDGEPACVVLTRQVGGRRRAVKLDRAVPRGAELAVPRDELPALPDDSYYVSELVGMEVVDEGGHVGVVRDVLPGPANDALELDTGLLLPLVEDCVREVDLAARRIFLNPGFTS